MKSRKNYRKRRYYFTPNLKAKKVKTFLRSYKLRNGNYDIESLLASL